MAKIYIHMHISLFEYLTVVLIKNHDISFIINSKGNFECIFGKNT